MNDSDWSVGAWVQILDAFEREARRRCRYDVRSDEFTVYALLRLTTGMAVSLAVYEGCKAVEAAYRRYLRRRVWVTDCITN